MNTKAFSIIELVIAISLASFVLVGVASIAAQMARSQVEGIRGGTATGWSLVSYLSMAKEIEDANVLAYPIANGAAADSLVVCKNWSRMQGALPGGPLDTNAGAMEAVVQYCVDTTDPANLVVRRFANVSTVAANAAPCPCPGAPGPCGAAPVTCTSAPTGTWTETGVIGYRMERLAGFPSMFTRDDGIGGVRVRYVIGRQTPTVNDPNPKNTPFNFGIAMQKQYSSTLD
ncbi:MAG: hypothetical protein HY923_02980 [Elusimicrobia bacterium]|nr:hypothetical protein [Elusimicrobiota bacterium]